MMSDLEHCLAILKALQIAEVSYCLSGGGDQGTVELNHVLHADGRCGPIVPALPPVTVGISDSGGTISLDERLDNLIYDVPEFDWINNEGGSGTVILYPQETDPDCQVECDMTYGEDGDGQDFEDEDEEELLAEFNAGDPADEPIAIDDSALQPPKNGDRQ
jgi:hypothetical protein